LREQEKLIRICKIFLKFYFCKVSTLNIFEKILKKRETAQTKILELKKYYMHLKK